jgi:hypothetical protein
VIISPVCLLIAITSPYRGTKCSTSFIGINIPTICLNKFDWYYVVLNVVSISK